MMTSVVVMTFEKSGNDAQHIGEYITGVAAMSMVAVGMSSALVLTSAFVTTSVFGDVSSGPRNIREW